MCCTCWYDEDYDGKVSGSGDGNEDKDIFTSPYNIIVFLVKYIHMHVDMHVGIPTFLVVRTRIYDD